MSSVRNICIRLYGPFAANWSDGAPIDIRGAKLRALIALLATAPDGKRTRAYLQDMLWARAGHHHGRTSLRGALTSLRRSLGDGADAALIATKDEVAIPLDRIEVIGKPADGPFLEGVEIAEDRFEGWLRDQRQRPKTGGFAQPQVSLRPSLAILPFVKIQGDDQAVYFGDMLAQEVTRSLARSNIIDVLSHLSCRNVNPSIQALGEISGQLGCDYLVCGSLRVKGPAFRADVDLVEVASSKILWTRDFTGDIADVISGASGKPQEIATAIGKSVVESAVELAVSRPLSAVATHTLLMSGVSLMHQQSLSNYSKARTYIEETIRRAPTKAEPRAWLAKWHALNVSQGWSTDPARDAEVAEAETLRALDLEPDCPFSLSTNAYINNNLLKRFDASMAQFELALDIEPNNAQSLLLKGALHAFIDEGATAVELSERASALSPLDPHKYFFDTLTATAHLANRNFEAALALAERSFKVNRRHVSTLRIRAIALEALDRHGEAVKAAETLMRRQPSMSVAAYLDKHPAADFRTGREWAALLMAAGVPE